jgi:hypothetical protein
MKFGLAGDKNRKNGKKLGGGMKTGMNGRETKMDGDGDKKVLETK